MSYIILCLCAYMCVSNCENIPLKYMFIWRRHAQEMCKFSNNWVNLEVTTQVFPIPLGRSRCALVYVFTLSYSTHLTSMQILGKFRQGNKEHMHIKEDCQKCYIIRWFCVEIYDDRLG